MNTNSLDNYDNIKSITKSMWMHPLHGAIENQLLNVIEYYFVLHTLFVLVVILAGLYL